MTEQDGPELRTLTVRILMRLKRCRGGKLIITPWTRGGSAAGGTTLTRAFVKSHRWRRRIESGDPRSFTDLAEQEG